jgi:hypothetical protein
MMVWELALLPPLARFFIGLLLILIVVGSAVLFTYWIFTQYGEEE